MLSIAWEKGKLKNGADILVIIGCFATFGSETLPDIGTKRDAVLSTKSFRLFFVNFVSKAAICQPGKGSGNLFDRFFDFYLFFCLFFLF